MATGAGHAQVTADKVMPSLGPNRVPRRRADDEGLDRPLPPGPVGVETTEQPGQHYW